MSPTDPSQPRADVLPNELTQRWEVPECPFVIDYPAALLDRIRQRAEDSFYALAHGGLEIGGVLFGRVHPNARAPLRVELVAERPIQCKHTDGPWMVLSEDEKAEVGVLLERARRDPELASFAVIGFWVSHGRSDLALTRDDLDLYRSIFPNPWQVVLVLKPQTAALTRGAFFFRRDGEIGPLLPEQAFAVASLPGSLPAAGADEPKSVSQEPPARAASPGPRDDPKRKSRLSLRKIVVMLLLLLAAETGVGVTTWIVTLHKPPQELGLEVFTEGPELLVHWNARAVEVENARSAELVVQEQESTQRVPLDRDSVRRGFVRYHPSSPQSRLTMLLKENSGRVDEVIAIQH